MGRIDSAMTWVKDYLDNMPAETQVAVRDVPVRDKELLVECVKYYIDVYGFARFNSDYSKVIKQDWK